MAGRLARLARTVVGLHPVQVLARGPALLGSRVVRWIPTGHAPDVAPSFPPAPAALVALALAERERARARLPRLVNDPSLLAYERVYGLELATDGEGPLPYDDPMAVRPAPASIRARRIAVAIRAGARRELRPELARACRAVALQPELHLLGNHLLENGLGLACGGAIARGGEADLWWRIGRAIVDAQIDTQFLADGGHFERSATYHAQCLASLLEAIELADAGGRGAPARWRRAASRAADFLARVRTPDGALPLFNDAALDAAPDVDRILDLARALDVFSSIDAPPSNVWARHFEATGWVVIGDGSRDRLVVDAGADGAPHQPGHVHADALTYELFVDGARTIVDFGVAGYDRGAARDETRATRVHNTVEIDGHDSAEVWAGFRVGRRTGTSIRALDVDRDGARLEATHDGYRALPGAPAHVRVFTFARRRLTVVDRVEGGFRSAASRVRLDRAAGARLHVEGSGAVAQRSSVWYARHAEARPAVVLEQRLVPSAPTCQWTFTW